MSGFTPGPWFIHEARERDERDISTVSSRRQLGQFVATAWGGGDYMNKAIDANARLIAAAPDLYAALSGLLADIQEYQRINDLGGEDNHWQVQARAALAKADGR